MIARSAGASASGSTMATIISPKRWWGTPTTTASRTPAWVLIASSTSSGNTFSPPVLMHTDPRPNKVMVPSASTVA